MLPLLLAVAACITTVMDALGADLHVPVPQMTGLIDPFEMQVLEVTISVPVALSTLESVAVELQGDTYDHYLDCNHEGRTVHWGFKLRVPGLCEGAAYWMFDYELQEGFWDVTFRPTSMTQLCMENLESRIGQDIEVYILVLPDVSAPTSECFWGGEAPTADLSRFSLAFSGALRVATSTSSWSGIKALY